MPPKRTPATISAPAPKSLPPNSSIYQITNHVWAQYLTTTAQRTMLLDAFMAFLVLIGGVQFVYCVLAGNYPFNAFLSGLCAAVGQFVLTASLRMQMGEGRKSGSKGMDGRLDSVSHERAFADYIFGSLILHFFCINFIN